jgi:diguanylate cyclase (GGDEF)-like protein
MMLGQMVSYKGQEVVLAYLYDISNMKKKNFELERSTRLRALMLEVTQSIFIANSIEDIFDLSLVNSIKALEKSNYGSIMVRDGNIFKPVSYIGFTNDIRDFRLPCDQSFLARNTDNKMDRFVRINQDQLGVQTDFNKSNSDSIMIRSTLTGPIYIEGNLYGIINIDSLENNAFDDSDVQTMEFIRNNVEIAITNHLLYQEKLVLSRYDSLTGLHNRHFFEEQFELNRKRANRYNESFAIVLFDIDNFKSINDRYGHFVGDQVLKHIAKQLLNNQRESDIMARFGGDEFIGVLYSSNIQELNKKYIEINNELNRLELNVENTLVSCTFSFGIAEYPKDGKSLDELVKVADFEMYKNKRSRKFD